MLKNDGGVGLYDLRRNRATAPKPMATPRRERVAGSGTAEDENAVNVKLSIAKPASLPTSFESVQRKKIDSPWASERPVIEADLETWLDARLPSRAPLVVTGAGPTKLRAATVLNSVLAAVKYDEDVTAADVSDQPATIVF